jgi:hypothetical protein
MAMEGVRGYLQLASGLAEVSRSKAMDAASGLLSLSGALSSGVGNVPGAGTRASVGAQVQELAEELLAAAAANRRSLLALIRSEIESALSRSPLVPLDELDRARAAVAKLSADVEELREQVLGSRAVRAMPQPARSAFVAASDAVSDAMSGAASSVLGSSGGAPAAMVTPPMPTVAPGATIATEPSRAEKSTPETSTPRKSTPRKSTARKSTARKSTPKKSAPQKSSAAKASTAKTSAAKTSAAKTSAEAQKTSAAKTSAAKKSTAKKSTPRKTSARKTTATKGTAK